MTDRDYSIITGAGRSGSQWLLQLFDLHPSTHCRNEPHRLDDALRHPENAGAWKDAIERACTHYGITDLPITAPKNHFYSPAQSLGLYKLMFRRRTWRAFGYGEDWRVPRWIGSRVRFEKSKAILKIINTRKAIDYLLVNDAPVPIIHLVRHPAGMLNSWNRRFLKPRDEQSIHGKQHAILRSQLEEWPEYASMVGPVDGMDLDEAKIWCWRFDQERIATVGQGRATYLRIKYEELAMDPIPILRSAYEHVGLDWPAADIEPRVRAMCRMSTSIGTKWRDELKPNQIACVERVMRDSTVANWWPDL